MAQKIVDSKAYPLKELFADKFTVDFYQREYVWQHKQLADLIGDLSTEFLKSWRKGDYLEKVAGYDPYFMGEIILSTQESGPSSVIDGQQRITTFTLLLIYLLNNYGEEPHFPRAEVEKLVYSDYYGKPKFNLDIPERYDCMYELYKHGEYTPKKGDSPSVLNIVERYEDIPGCWDSRIDKDNVVAFTYWIKERVYFSKVWTNSDDFAYVIFETMNDRGLSLTYVEMLRSYLLANIDPSDRPKSMRTFDAMVGKLKEVSASSKAKTEDSFFKYYLRGHLAESMSQSKGSGSDFLRIGSEYHRWIRDNSQRLGLEHSDDFLAFIDRLSYFADVFAFVDDRVCQRDTGDYLYLVVNSDYGLTLQPAAVMAAVSYLDDDKTVKRKTQAVSKYLAKVLTWRVWNHYAISQSSMEALVYDLCVKMRGLDAEQLDELLSSDPVDGPYLEGAPTLNQQNRKRLCVLLSLVTEIVARESGEPGYMLNKKDVEVEHIWANHYLEHASEFDNEAEFSGMRNNIGDLLVLPKSFNASYGDDPYADKVGHYYGQNILAQSLNELKYQNNPGFARFVSESGLPFKPYAEFTKDAIVERAELYRRILEWNWPDAKKREDAGERYWWFTARPDYWSFDELGEGEEVVYTAYNDEGNKRQVFANYQAAKPGDRFVGYHSYPEMRVVCTGAVMSGLDESLPPLEQGVAIGEKVEARAPLAYAEMVADPVLGTMDHLKKGRTGSLFSITKEQYERIVELTGKKD